MVVRDKVPAQMTARPVNVLAADSTAVPGLDLARVPDRLPSLIGPAKVEVPRSVCGVPAPARVSERGSSPW